MIRIAICEDNGVQREIISDMLGSVIDDLGITAEVLTFNDADSMLDHVARMERFDIYLLDIVMPGISGFDAAMKFRMNNDNGKIIFLSATLDYVLSSYDVHAFYYLLKPVDPQKFKTVMTTAFQQLGEVSLDYTIKLPDTVVKVKKNEIVYAQLYGKTVIYKLANGKLIKSTSIRTSFKDAVAGLLKMDFFSMSSVGEIINLNFVAEVDPDGIVLRDGTMLFPSKNYYKEFKSDFLNFGTDNKI